MGMDISMGMGMIALLMKVLFSVCWRCVGSVFVVSWYCIDILSMIIIGI